MLAMNKNFLLSLVPTVLKNLHFSFLILPNLQSLIKLVILIDTFPFQLEILLSSKTLLPQELNLALSSSELGALETGPYKAKPNLAEVHSLLQ